MGTVQMNTYSTLAVAAGVISLSFAGCTTHRFGRMSELSHREADAMSCSHIASEINEAEAFLADIYSTSFDGADAMGVFLDFGIGNAAEKSAALTSGKKRLQSLYMLRESRCGVPFPEDWEAHVKAEAQVMEDEKKARRRHAATQNPRHVGDYIVTEPPTRRNPYDEENRK